MQNNDDRDDLLEELFGGDYSYLINEIKNYGEPEGDNADKTSSRSQEPQSTQTGDTTRKFSDDEFEKAVSRASAQSDTDSRSRDDFEYDYDDYEYTSKKKSRKKRRDRYEDEYDDRHSSGRYDYRESERYQDQDDEDDYYDDDDDDDRSPIRRRDGKRLGCINGILYALLVICISLLLGAVLWLAATDVLAFGKESAEIEITVPDSYMYETQEEVTDDDGVTTTQTVTKANIDDISQMLREDGVIKYEKLFKLFCKVTHAEDKIKAGTYELNLNYDYRAIVNGLRPSSGKLVEISVTIPEGYTMSQIFTLLEEAEVCTKSELEDTAANYDFDYDFLDSSTLGQAKRLEGYLFPDTYKFYVSDEPERVINKLLSNFDSKFTDEYRQMAEDMGYSIKDVITIASMIEKEAGADSDRDLIASVIYNRLNNSSSFPYLQIDATIYYAIEDTDEEFSTDIVSPYNTYTTAGLPAGPISNPGIASIRAALQPEETSYYYYALSTSGTHKFFKTYDEFLEFVNSEEYGG
jgi:UPF0755 protein